MHIWVWLEKNHISKLQKFIASISVSQKSWAVDLNIFRFKKSHFVSKIILKNMIFVTIALTQLNVSNDWYMLLKASHLQLSSVSKSDWRKVNKELASDDVIIWREDLTVLESSEEDEKFINLTYDVQREWAMI